MKVDFYPIEDSRSSALKYVVLQCRYNDQWIFVRHEERTTWEIPGGHIEPGETPDEAAARELVEETGALTFDVEPLCDYSVSRGSDTNFGRLYYCDVKSIGPLGDSEIGEVTFLSALPSNLTYEKIQPFLFDKVKEIKGL